MLHFRDADRAAEIRRLDKDRIPEGFYFIHDVVRLVAPVEMRKAEIWELRYIHFFQNRFGDDLIHADGRPHNTATNIGYPYQVEHTLEAAVFTIGPMYERKYDIRLDRQLFEAFYDILTGVLRMAQDGDIIRTSISLRFFQQCLVCLRSHHTLSCFQDANGNDIIFLTTQSTQYALRRIKRNPMFDAPTSEDNQYDDL